MKAFKKVLLLSAVLLMGVACTKDDDDDNNNNNNNANLETAIVGTWDQTLMEEKNGKITMNGMTYMTYTAKSINDQSTWVFGSSPKEVDINVAFDYVMTSNLAGMTNTDTTALSAMVTANYTTSGNNKLTITDQASGEVMMFDVISISNNKMELKTTASIVDSSSGFTMTSSADVYYTLEK